MSSFGAQMRKRLNELKRAGQDVPRIIAEVAEGATIAAVETATKNTPPNTGNISGTNTRSSGMADHWTTDSQTTPVNGKTILANGAKNANGMQYASYVNDGHRMDKHFVPGLVINGNLLEVQEGVNRGLTVGTKTTYVPGLHMKEKAIGKYRDVVRKELSKRVEEAFK